MMNAILAAQHPHTFLFSQWEVHSKGNPLTHAILRGSVNKYGRSLPNYHYENLNQLWELYAKSGLENPASSGISRDASPRRCSTAPATTGTSAAWSRG